MTGNVVLQDLTPIFSAFEHAVPERLFADQAKPITDPTQPQGVSAVKALAIAASQGQKIYTLNAKNHAYHASIIGGLVNADADTKEEISNALYAGKEVTVHQSDITVNGWTGSGYIILDPDSGAGAYKISGGANGGSLNDDDVAMISLGALSDLLAELASGIGKILGTFLGHLLDALDAIEIWDACKSTESKIGALTAFAVYSIAFGALFAAIANPLSFMPIVLIILFAVLISIIMNFMVDAIVGDCQRYP